MRPEPSRCYFGCSAGFDVLGDLMARDRALRGKEGSPVRVGKGLETKCTAIGLWWALAGT